MLHVKYFPDRITTPDCSTTDCGWWTAAKRSDWVPPQYWHRWCLYGFGSGTHASTLWYISLPFCHGQRWSQLSIGNLLHTSKRCLFFLASAKIFATLFGLDATQQQATWPTSFCFGWEGTCFFPLETTRCLEGNIDWNMASFRIRVRGLQYGEAAFLFVKGCLRPDTGLPFFFSPHLFFRRRSHDDCFTGQSPGNAISIRAAPDVHDWLGQIQASAPEGRAGRRLVGGGGEGALLREAGWWRGCPHQ